MLSDDQKLFIQLTHTYAITKDFPDSLRKQIPTYRVFAELVSQIIYETLVFCDWSFK